MKAIEFAEWLAENHYRLLNVNANSGVKFWANESKCQKTTKQLYKEFENCKTKKGYQL